MASGLLHLARRAGFFAYLLECADGTYYAGAAKDLNARITLHNTGKGAKYVRGRTPARLVYARLYRSLGKALRAEAGLKKLTRKQKESLVRAYEN